MEPAPTLQQAMNALLPPALVAWREQTRTDVLDMFHRAGLAGEPITTPVLRDWGAGQWRVYQRTPSGRRIRDSTVARFVPSSRPCKFCAQPAEDAAAVDWIGPVELVLCQMHRLACTAKAPA